ncbi:dienelactone hydrolase [Mycolicibacterium sp. BK556]|uniref:dienelactone hydrolase family protein n=1 Tax=unclassified Mycolicibacterium TaxID=2636767 RepID=UPI00160A89EE|nr:MULTISPECIES: dienelactone hydrolase family protein [unclassified Mycolicibacterium]MBB3605643.1 dienelactone hydrolase [Mycolicibacterium sp. BK556]MBB3635860.1 dienelactone hydrolase [Mycolicibacterium sp. BK607]MBB3753273.1 dienelactone hydrolase [Mycolicibacterium sp. BK634]
MPGPEADLTGWIREPFSAAGFTHDVYRKGSGPGVVLIPEIPGIHPGGLALGNYLVDNGFTVAMPSLFGTPGAPARGPMMVPTLARACVTKEFAAFATNKNRPVTNYLRALARDLKEKAGGKGVGVIGQCFTGGFALAAAVDDSVLASVLSQPSVPIGLTLKAKRDPGMSEGELQVIEKRAAEEGLCAMGLRFSEDPMSPPERFKTLKDRLGDAFEVIELDSSKGNKDGFGRIAHSVLALEVREQEGHPAFEARKRVVQFLKAQLT